MFAGFSVGSSARILSPTEPVSLLIERMKSELTFTWCRDACCAKVSSSELEMLRGGRSAVSLPPAPCCTASPFLCLCDQSSGNCMRWRRVQCCGRRPVGHTHCWGQWLTDKGGKKN
eukprot:2308513-Rhodomonas_salina.1